MYDVTGVVVEIVGEVFVEALVQVLKVVKKDWAIAYMYILVSCILLKRLYIYVSALATQIYDFIRVLSAPITSALRPARTCTSWILSGLAGKYNCVMPKYGLVDRQKMPIL